MAVLSMQRRRPRIVLAASAGIGAVDFAQLFDCFRQWADVRLIATRTARPFIRQRPLPSGTQVTIEEGDPVSHVELCQWADLMVISPLCFNTLSAMARGKRDNLVTCMAQVWDHRKPIFFAPSMASNSWTHEFREQYLTTLVEDLGMNPIMPTQEVVPRGGEGYMVCYMADVNTVHSTVRTFYENWVRSGRHPARIIPSFEIQSLPPCEPNHPYRLLFKDEW